MPRHARASVSAASSTITISPPSHSYLQNTSYGLLEPKPLSIRPPPHRPSIQHRRKSSSSSSSPVWSDWEFDFKDLKGKSVDLSEKIGDKLPGVKYSAAFLSTLRVNLALSTSLAPPSPNLLAISPGLPSTSKLSSTPFTAMPTSPTSVSAPDSDPLAGIPPLDFEPASSLSDRFDALKLISDSITQQRGLATTRLIIHPFTLAIFALCVAAAYPFLVKSTGDLPILFTTSVGFVMLILGIIRFALKPYEELADKINWEWLGEDQVVVARFGGTVIGTCVYRLEAGSGTKRKSHQSSSSTGSNSSGSGSGNKKALVRAWTVRRRERGRGVGRGLLESVVDFCAKEKGCESVEFAPAGIRAGGERALPDWEFGGLMKLNGEFDSRDKRAEECLRDVAKEKGFGEKRRRGSR